MINFSTAKNSYHINKNTCGEKISTGLNYKHSLKPRESLIETINNIEKKMETIKKTVKQSKKRKSNKIPNPFTFKMIFDLFQETKMKKKKRNKNRRNLEPIKENRKRQIVHLPNYFNLLYPADNTKQSNDPNLMEEQLYSDTISNGKETKEYNPVSYISVLSNNLNIDRSNSKNKKDSITNEFVKAMTENTIYTSSGSRSQGTLNRIKDSRENLPRKKTFRSNRYKNLIKKLVKVVNAILFCRYLVFKYKDIKDKRKQIAYLFYTKFYGEVQDSMKSFIETTTKEILAQFITNKKIIDFTSKHTSTTKIHSIIREYSVN